MLLTQVCEICETEFSYGGRALKADGACFAVPNARRKNFSGRMRSIGKRGVTA